MDYWQFFYAVADSESMTKEVHIESSVYAALQRHVFDMDVGILRAVIAQAAGPPNSTLAVSCFFHICKL